MCNLNDDFILCSCSAKKENGETPFTWTLFRQHMAEPEIYVIGETIPPYYSGKGQLLVATLRDQLNERNCFDFDYTPKRGDTLLITSTETGQEYAFIFNDDWEYEPMAFMGKTMRQIDSGKIQ